MLSLISSQILIETSAFPRRQALWLADGNRDVGTSPRPGWDSQPQQGSCPARGVSASNAEDSHWRQTRQDREGPSQARGLCSLSRLHS